MKSKSLAAFVFLVFLAIGLMCLILSSGHRSASADPTDRASAGTGSAKEKGTDEAVSEEVPDQIIAYYFHGEKRCRTCLTIEAYTEEALKEKFEGALKQGKLIWRPVDITAPENKHFVTDFQLVAQSVVLSAVKHGKQTKWKNLDKVWQLVRNKQAFFSYIQGETAHFMEE